MRYQLVIQWPSDDSAAYERMLEAEECLEECLTNRHLVDGHDVGAGECNIFVHTDDHALAFAEVEKVLREASCWDGVRIAYRQMSGDGYHVLWPETLRTFEVR